MNTVTIVFKYNQGPEWQEFWQKQIADRICHANSGSDIQVTTWFADKDCVAIVKDIEAMISD